MLSVVAPVVNEGKTLASGFWRLFSRLARMEAEAPAALESRIAGHEERPVGT